MLSAEGFCCDNITHHSGVYNLSTNRGPRYRQRRKIRTEGAANNRATKSRTICCILLYAWNKRGTSLFVDAPHNGPSPNYGPVTATPSKRTVVYDSIIWSLAIEEARGASLCSSPSVRSGQTFWAPGCRVCAFQCVDTLNKHGKKARLDPDIRINLACNNSYLRIPRITADTKNPA